MGKMKISNISTHAALILSKQVMDTRGDVFVYPVDETLPPSWARILDEIFQEATDIYCYRPRECWREKAGHKSMRWALEHLGKRGPRSCMRRVGRVDSVRISDREGETSLQQRLSAFASRGKDYSLALYDYEENYHLFLHMNGEGLFFIDWFSKWPSGGAVVIQCPTNEPTQLKQFMNGLKMFAAMDGDAFGEFIPLISDDEPPSKPPSPHFPEEVPFTLPLCALQTPFYM